MTSTTRNQRGQFLRFGLVGRHRLTRSTSSHSRRARARRAPPGRRDRRSPHRDGQQLRVQPPLDLPRRPRGAAPQAARFAAVSIDGLPLRAARRRAAHRDCAGSPRSAAQPASIAAALPLSFAGNRAWAFADRATAAARRRRRGHTARAHHLARRPHLQRGREHRALRPRGAAAAGRGRRRAPGAHRRRLLARRNRRHRRRPRRRARAGAGPPSHREERPRARLRGRVRPRPRRRRRARHPDGRRLSRTTPSTSRPSSRPPRTPTSCSAPATSPAAASRTGASAAERSAAAAPGTPAPSSASRSGTSPAASSASGASCSSASSARASRPAGFGFQVEVTYRSLRSGATVREVPIRFRDREAGDSKMSSRIVIEALWRVVEMRLRAAHFRTPAVRPAPMRSTAF